MINQLLLWYESLQFNSYCELGSWNSSIIFNLILGTIIFILSKITNQYSWGDRIWSILPSLYSFHIVYYQTSCQNIPASQRQILMLLLTVVWGTRLTYNFWRKGGYAKGGQDYRWIYLRQKYPKILVELLNFIFTSYYQILLIYLFSSPIKFAQQNEIALLDYIALTLWIFLFIGEVLADQQQWNFQTKKYELLRTNNNQKQKLPEPYKTGYLKSGLFAISRHPNFFCQISIWWVFYLFSHSSVGFNYSIVGAILLTLLFQGSTDLTQKISCEKYPSYKQYQQQVSRLIPFMIISNKKIEEKIK